MFLATQLYLVFNIITELKLAVQLDKLSRIG